MAKPGTLPTWDETEVNSVVPDPTHQDEGWLAPGGIPEKPPFQTFNYWMNSVWKWLKEFNRQGIVEWDASTTYELDDITKGSDGFIYISVSGTNTNNNPTTEPEWEMYLADATEILEAVKTVDGSGSGLDADTVDTYHVSDVGIPLFKGFSTTGRQAVFEGDLNTLLHNSIYNISFADVTNEPSDLTAVAFIHTMVLSSSTDFATQMLYSMNSGDKVWMRRRSSAVWSDWFRVDGLGVDQAWQNVGNSYAVLYTNTTGKTIEVAIGWVASANTNAKITVDGLQVAAMQTDSSGYIGGITAIVPNGSTYIFNRANASMTSLIFLELT